jgi:hypothetical protein
MQSNQNKPGITCNDKDIELARQRLEEWRKNKKHREPIPEELWQLAVELSSRFGISQVARELRLNFMALKKRVTDKTGQRKIEIDKGDSFMEIKMLPGDSYVPVNSSCVMELTRVDGANLKIYSAVGGHIDIVKICGQFLNG